MTNAHPTHGRSAPPSGRTTRSAPAAAILLALAGVAACGGTSGPGSHTHGATTPPASAGVTGTAAIPTITRNWEAFFDAKTPASQKEALLENGTEFAAFIAAEEKNPLAAALSATVTKVGLPTTSAAVSYTLHVGVHSYPLSGLALDKGGAWLVSDGTFCGLADLLGSPPKVCNGVSATS